MRIEGEKRVRCDAEILKSEVNGSERFPYAFEIYLEFKKNNFVVSTKFFIF